MVSSPWLGPSLEGAQGWRQVKVPSAATCCLMPSLQYSHQSPSLGDRMAQERGEEATTEHRAVMGGD